MFTHYLTSALRNFRRFWVRTLINVVGLSLGLACFMAAYMFLDYVASSDTQHSNSDRTYVVFTQGSMRAIGLEFPFGSSSSSLLAEYLRVDAPELETLARARGEGNLVALVDGVPSYRDVVFVDSEFLEIFDLPFVAGSSAQALTQSRSAILTQAAADSLFGSGEVLGRMVDLEELGEVPVAGVLGPLPKPSHLDDDFEILVVTDREEDIQGPQFQFFPEDMKWILGNVTTYVLFTRDSSLSAAELTVRLKAIETGMPEEVGAIDFDVRPVSSIGTANLESFIFFDQDWISVSVMILLAGVVVLLTACLNFIGLSTAAAAFRAKEVGMRKVLGAKRAQIMRQHLLEAGLIVSISFVFALAILQLSMPVLNEILPVEFEIPWLSAPRLWAFLGLLAVIVTMLAGAYPAVVLGHVRPVSALGAATLSRPGLFRRLLVGAQFATTSFLLTMVVIMQMQNFLMYRTGLGILDDPYVVLEGEPRNWGTTFDLLRSELMRAPQILAVTASGTAPWEGMLGGTSFSATPEESAESVFTQHRNVTRDYFETLGIELLAGRWHTQNEADRANAMYEEDWAEQEARENDPDGADRDEDDDDADSGETGHAIVNRAAIEQFGWIDPEAAVGGLIYRTFRSSEGFESFPVEIIGVIEGAPFGLVSFGYNAFVYGLGHPDTSSPVIRVDRNDIPGALAHIDSVWAGLVPDIPLRRDFMDERFERMFEFFSRISRGILILAIFAVGITNMGLFGMASFVTARRRREVGVRKSVGATSMQILRLFLSDFSKPILIASLIAWPLAFLAARAYLSIFIERIPLTPVPFVLSLGLTLAIAWLAVATQVLGAARLKPAEVLRYE